MRERHTLERVDRIIHEPARSTILALLYSVDCANFLTLLWETNLSKGNLSVHLSRLKKAGYIEIEKTYRGNIPQTLLRITNEGKKAFEEYQSLLRAFLENN
jgi:DNA-binding MarR family transcriptional regulator